MNGKTVTQHQTRRFSLVLLATALPLLALVLTFSIQRMQAAPTGTTYYVARSGDGADGLSWATAFTDVQDALNLAGAGDQIWVATGVYTPGTTVSDTFRLRPGVALYGGFDTADTVLADRDWVANPTVLSGDIGGDDTVDASGIVITATHISGGNSYHVVTGGGVTGTSRLDGFFITAGQANGSYFFPCGPACGGGLYNDGSSPTVTNVIFSGNSAQSGGGMYNTRYGSSPILINVTFSSNSAASGGGMVNIFDSSPTLTNVTFSGNSATSGPGGGMWNYWDSSPVLTNVTFSGNSAQSGGGMGNWHRGSPTLTNVTFSGNSATSGDGGGMYNSGSSPVLTNVTFSGNSATSGDGGGMYNTYFSSPTVHNAVLWGNKDSSGSGTITATVALTNSSTVTLSHSLVQGSGGSGSGLWGGGYVNGGNNIDKDPLFVTPVDAASAPTSAGNLRLRFGSQAIDTGDNSVVTVATDLDGNPRIMDGNRDGNAVVDMGAYEFSAMTISKSGPAIVKPGALITYTLDVKNETLITLTNLVITDAIPVGANYVTGGTRVGNVVSWTVGSLAASGSITRQFVVTATDTIINRDYRVSANGGYAMNGGVAVVTLVQERVYLPLVLKTP